MRRAVSKQLVMHGMALGLDSLTNLLFDNNKPYSGCCICGAVFQSAYDRAPAHFVTPRQFPTFAAVQDYAYELRREWSLQHAKTHSENQHRALKLSGRWATPEAALKLAAYGTIPLVDLAIDDEVSHALRESKPIPIDDAQDRS